jgi:hypothetical protein
MGQKQSNVSIVNTGKGEGQTNLALNVDGIVFSPDDLIKIISVEKNVEHKPLNQLDENVLALPNLDQHFVIESISSEQFKWTDGLNPINVHIMRIYTSAPEGHPNSYYNVLITDDRMVLPSGNGENDYRINIEEVNQ